MKRFQQALVLGLFCISAAAAADSIALNGFKPRFLPVLVQVNSHGKITSVSPSTELSPPFERLLRQSLNDMISKPAIIDGRPMASQFVINLALKVTPRKDGKYDARFAYVSAVPVPSGSWYWSHEDGVRLALESSSGINRRQPPPFQAPPEFRRAPMRYNDSHMGSPPAQVASKSASMPAKSN